MKDAYRVGIIGFGRVGRRRADLVNAPRLELAAVADPELPDAAAFSPSLKSLVGPVSPA